MKSEFIEYIEDISGDYPNSKSINKIRNWLDKYKRYYYNAIRNSSCRKWANCSKSSEKPFPCVCPTREKDCIFIEFYSKLKEVFELNMNEEYYAKQLVKFSAHKLHKESVIEWVRDNKSYYKDLDFKLNFDSIGLVVSVRVNNHNERIRHMLVNINKEEFKHATEFKKIFDEMIYVDFI